jgi:Fe-S-cluster-containing hydrogenase component 2
MLIDKTKCVNCGQCIPYCPMACIQKKDGIVQIDLDECVECEACRNARVCPRDALYMQKLEGTRILRSQFSNPLITHPKTGVPGRGTEEMKTNDVTGRFKRGRAGVCIEL